MKLPESQRGPTDFIKSGIYYRMVRDTDGEICKYQSMYIFDDHSTYNRIEGDSFCPQIRDGDWRMYNHPINEDTTVSRESKVIDLIDRHAMEFDAYDKDYILRGNWRVNGDTLDVRAFSFAGQCIHRVFSWKYLIINDSTLQVLSLPNKEGEANSPDKEIIARHRKFPIPINPPTSTRKYWD